MNKKFLAGISLSMLLAFFSGWFIKDYFSQKEILSLSQNLRQVEREKQEMEDPLNYFFRWDYFEPQSFLSNIRKISEITSSDNRDSKIRDAYYQIGSEVTNLMEMQNKGPRVINFETKKKTLIDKIEDLKLEEEKALEYFNSVSDEAKYSVLFLKRYYVPSFLEDLSEMRKEKERKSDFWVLNLDNLKDDLENLTKPDQIKNWRGMEWDLTEANVLIDTLAKQYIREFGVPDVVKKMKIPGYGDISTLRSLIFYINYKTGIIEDNHNISSRTLIYVPKKLADLRNK